MSSRHPYIFALALTTLLSGCSGQGQGQDNKSPIATAAPATTTPIAATSVVAPATPLDLVDLATDESCRQLALQVIRQHDRTADRVFLKDTTPAGRYRRDGNVIGGDHGQYRNDDGWTPLTSFRCTVDDAGKALSFEYQPGKMQTWADMGNQH